MKAALPTGSIQIRARPPSALACIACRSRHVKCSGETPVCRRCQDKAIECSYKQSRRGYKGPRKTSTKVRNSDDGILARDVFHMNYPASPFTSASSNGCEESGPMSHAEFGSHAGIDGQSVRASTSVARENGDAVSSMAQALSTMYHGSTNITSRSYDSHFSERGNDCITAESKNLTDIFYANFYNAHPFLIPRKLHCMRPSLIPPHLQKVLHFVASHFLKTPLQNDLRSAAEKITSDLIPNDGYKVQGLMLLGMVLFSRCEQESAIITFNQAIDIALELGMNHGTYVANNGAGNAIIEESWRRTWWELYVVDGILASLNNVRHPFRLQHVPTDIQLPCEDEEYAQCDTSPSLHSQGEFLERAFAAEPQIYSSMAYKIEAVRLLGNVVSLGQDAFGWSDDEMESLDASLASFLLSLPMEKRHCFGRDGRVDEVLFMAHSIIDCASILLHRPRSTLVFVRNHYPTNCTREEIIGLPASAYEVHTSKAIKAADSISALLTNREQLASHSPCFVCAIAMASIVHLPAYALETNTHRAGSIRERLQLSLNALNLIGEVWPSARIAKSQIAQFAREIFAAQKAAIGSMRAEEQVQQIDFGSTGDDSSWIDELVNFRSNENAMTLNGAATETMSVASADTSLPF